MKVIVDYDLCEANAVCMKVCPEVFELRDDDTLHLRTTHPDETLRAKVEEAVRRCPRQALSIQEE
jgi:ferredoxin